MDSIIQEQTLIVVLGGLVVIMLSTGPKVHRFKPNLAEDNGFFKGDKNLQHDFLSRGSKAVSPML
jgi:hypothetical protein